ncbi:GNAT family N-acetyltransferase [Pseudomonas sp. HS6]|uniref:GNAT family N-acetyltransferase n=1 Tax=Pseudomonas sp. HS6 TaxID=2850559 RepID=UPI002018F05E|nr:GNAT family N-acetyltransferase [Pseudomonas sp. HS6]UQS16506.1 GNAT family N-acetyltransferase [Pseudomonas sp. HS6]
METVTLRSFRSSDAPAVSNLFRKIYGDLYAQPHVYLPCMIDRNHALGHWHSLVAVAEDQTLGHATLIHARGSHIAELALSVVAPENRGQNIATRLGRQLLIHAQALGYRGVTIKQVTGHPYTQRMAASLGFQNVGWLPDYVPSPFNDSARESLIIGYTPIDDNRRPLPTLAWPESCRDFMMQMCSVFGTQDKAAPWVGEPVQLEQQSNRYEGTFKELDGGLLKQLQALPAHWLISIRLRLAKSFEDASYLLTAAGFVFTGLVPDERGAGWLALFHRGAKPPVLKLICPQMQRLHDDLQLQIARGAQ